MWAAELVAGFAVNTAQPMASFESRQCTGMPCGFRPGDRGPVSDDGYSFQVADTPGIERRFENGTLTAPRMAHTRCSGKLDIRHETLMQEQVVKVRLETPIAPAISQNAAFILRLDGEQFGSTDYRDGAMDSGD